MPSISDVARAAGVSTATVSRVLHNSDSVRPETRDQVMDAIKALGYRPNGLARQMRMQKTNNIIVIVPNIGNMFFSKILFGIEEAAREHGYNVLVANLHKQENVEFEFFRAALERTVDGVISLSANVARGILEQVADQSPVVVACQYLQNSSVPNVTIDNVRAAEEMTDRLIGLGHRKIVHLTGSPTFHLYQDRLNGYVSALAKHGIPIDVSLVRYGDNSFESGYESTRQLLAEGKEFSAIFAAGDYMAVGALRALREAGLSIPGDCSVAGFDDLSFSSYCTPTLTTVHQPRKEIGKAAFLKLLALMNGEELDQVQTVLNYEIRERESTGVPQSDRAK